jgi:hypothetical protein
MSARPRSPPPTGSTTAWCRSSTSTTSSSRTLTDRGTEFCGTSQAHEYELYLARGGHRPQPHQGEKPANQRHRERFHKTVLQEFYQVAFRKRIYTSLEQLQADLDAWITGYNETATTSGALVLRQDANANLP